MRGEYLMGIIMLFPRILQVPFLKAGTLFYRVVIRIWCRKGLDQMKVSSFAASQKKKVIHFADFYIITLKLNVT